MNMTDQAVVNVHQMLHGYLGGHRLLSSSCSVSKNSERRIRIMSDLSGASIKTGFDGYFTGYPLIEDELFALGKTWFATELPRPGCVWTHTLLIPFQSLRRIETLDDLLDTFRRPVATGIDGFDTMLSVQFSQQTKAVHESQDFASRVLAAVYETPATIVALAAKDAEQHRRLIFALWEQQWPSLRSKFSFCTGALELLAGENRLDIQAIPDEKRTVDKARLKAVILRDAQEGKSEREEWTEAVAEDLLTPGIKGMRGFLASYSDASHQDRADFKRYCQSFFALENSKSLKDVLLCIAREFPRTCEASKLKLAVAGPPSERSIFPHTAESEVLLTLLETDALHAFNIDSLDLGSRYRDLWLSDEAKAWQLLMGVASKSPSEQQEYLLDEIAQVVSKDSIARMAVERCDVAAEVVKRNMELAVVSEVWKCPAVTFPLIRDEFVASLDSSGILVDRILHAWIIADRLDCGRAFADLVGNRAAEMILGLNPEILSLLDRQAGGWLSILEASGDACMHWLIMKLDASAEAACLAVLGAEKLLRAENTFAPSHKLLEAWAKANQKYPNLSRKTISRAYATMLAIALENATDPASEPVASMCFPVIYEAALQNELPDRCWSILQGRLPQSGMWWDRCKKLRMGLLQHCVESGWARETFLRCTSVGFAFEQLLSSWGLTGSEKDYLSAVIRDISAGVTRANENQKNAVERYGHWF